MDESGSAEDFLAIARAYLDINALERDWKELFAHAVSNQTDPRRADAIKRDLALACLGLRLSPREYELATGWSFDSDEEFRDHLLDLWSKLDPRNSPREFIELLAGRS